MHYRAYLLDEDAHIIDAQSFETPNDEAALIHANQFAFDFHVAVWQRSRRVGLFNGSQSLLISGTDGLRSPSPAASLLPGPFRISDRLRRDRGRRPKHLLRNLNR